MTDDKSGIDFGPESSHPSSTYQMIVQAGNLIADAIEDHQSGAERLPDEYALSLLDSVLFDLAGVLHLISSPFN